MMPELGIREDTFELEMNLIVLCKILRPSTAKTSHLGPMDLSTFNSKALL
jgi:hypothetical protein